MATRCFLQVGGRWYALMNWHARGTRADTVALRPMMPREVETYETMKQRGYVEAAIFAQLYPPGVEPKPVREVVVPVVLLNKAQLVYLIEKKLSISLPSLGKMDKEDLMRLLGRL